MILQAAQDWVGRGRSRSCRVEMGWRYVKVNASLSNLGEKETYCDVYLHDLSCDFCLLVEKPSDIPSEEQMANIMEDYIIAQRERESLTEENRRLREELEALKCAK